MAGTKTYTKSDCSFYRFAKKLRNIKGITFVEYDITNDARFKTQMHQRTGRQTVPQILINNLHIGSCDDLFALNERGELDPLLQTGGEKTNHTTRTQFSNSLPEC